jgi:hypothetical protein
LRWGNVERKRVLAMFGQYVVAAGRGQREWRYNLQDSACTLRDWRDGGFSTPADPLPRLAPDPSTQAQAAAVSGLAPMLA